MPDISVIMPVYNGAQYLAQAIKSILIQTHTNFEFIIINDGSSDNTENIILSFHDSRIVYLKNNRNRGLVYSLNMGVALSKGQFIARMDSDDIARKCRFEMQLKFMQRNPQVDICGSWIALMGGGHSLRMYPLDHKSIKASMLLGSPLAHPTVFCRKTFFESHYYSDKSYPSEDYGLWALSVNTKCFANVPMVLLDYRVHNDQISTRLSNQQNESVRSIQTELFKKIGIEINERDFNIHLALQLRKSKVTLDEVFAWKEKVIQSSKCSKYFDVDRVESCFDEAIVKLLKYEKKMGASVPSFIYYLLSYKLMKLYVFYICSWLKFKVTFKV